jgi:hypothetical protein
MLVEPLALEGTLLEIMALMLVVILQVERREYGLAAVVELGEMQVLPVCTSS